ncbi:Protein p24a [Ceratocystis lukuohia]|uniref:Transmembrane 9 superfamily member n=3 Tax=Ceratocystis TaxID=5157 RepID=A0A0F8B197_CERFI|nr:Protein p24a [Ceratocystis platani]PHH49385.1 Transmembrane 9 superfamily member 7 [Ceratocystis fimbriata CBS 114723]
MRSPTLGSAAAAVASLLAFTQSASAFYLPGVAPNSYKPGDPVPLYVNSITPSAAETDNLIHAVISYDYYAPMFGFCQPKDGVKDVPESLGSILMGDRIKNSPFELFIGKDEQCKQLCTSKYNAEHLKFLAHRIKQGYSLNWLVDSLPAAQELKDTASQTTFYSPGFHLGSVSKDGQILMNNHYDIEVEYHEVANNPDQLRVVGVIIRPSSKKYSDSADCGSHYEPIVVAGGVHEVDVTFSYSVTWKKSATAWATRWDKYLHVFDPKIHWFWLIDIAIVVFILVMTVVSILVRTLRKDIARYNRLDQISLDDFGDPISMEDGVQEDSGWKLVHGDVFRPPSHPMLLSILVGSGVQIFGMTGLTIIFALLGFLSPSNRGSLGTVMILLYTVLGFVGGYVSARTYKAWNGEKWKVNIVLTPIVVPGVVFSAFFLMDLFLWASSSSGAVPFSTMLVLITIWFVISIPLSVTGSYMGFRAGQYQAPVKTNQIPRQIPSSTLYLQPIPSMLFVGLLPFGAIFVELFFIMSSIWFSRIYYMFGFLFLCYMLMIITCATATILMVYFVLCAENYNWQWRSFLAAGSMGCYIFVYCLLYLVSKVHVSSVAGAVLYIGYSSLLSLMFTVLAGSIGYLSSWWFVNKIYASLKID